LGLPISPAVRLSPKAAYFVTLSVRGVNVTLNAHVACRACASLAAQLTCVVPSGNDAPDAGVHVTDTGVAPPVTVGAESETGCEAPVIPVTVTSAGHAICGAVEAGGGSGPFGPEPQAAASVSVVAAIQRRVTLGSMFKVYHLA
jgi:hypothetical protein